MTTATVQQLMGFYLAFGLCLALLPGLVMANDGRAVYLRRVGQAIAAFSLVILLALTLHFV